VGRRLLHLCIAVAVLVSGCTGAQYTTRAELHVDTDRPEQASQRQNFTVGNEDGEYLLEITGNATGLFYGHAKHAGNDSLALEPLEFHANGAFNGTRTTCLAPGAYYLEARDKDFSGYADVSLYATRDHTDCPVFKTATDWKKTLGGVAGWLADNLLLLGSLAGAVTTILLLKDRLRPKREPKDAPRKR
jgi:hypothetical protein